MVCRKTNAGMPFCQYFGEKFLRKLETNGHLSVLAFFVFVEIIPTGHIEVPRNPRAWYSVEKDLTVGRNIHHNLIAGFKFVPRYVPNNPSRAEYNLTI